MILLGPLDFIRFICIEMHEWRRNRGHRAVVAISGHCRGAVKNEVILSIECMQLLLHTRLIDRLQVSSSVHVFHVTYTVNIKIYLRRVLSNDV